MRDEVKKPVVAPASRSRRAAVWGLVIVILAGLGYYFFAAPWSSAQRAQRARVGEGPGACHRSGGQTRRRAALSRRRRHQPRAQHRDRSPASRRQADPDRVRRRPGRQERRRAGAHRPDHVSGTARPGDRQEGAGRSAIEQCAARSRTLRAPRRHQLDQPPADRHATRDSRAARSPGEIGPGRDRQCARDSQLHDDCRANRRPRRPSPGG